MGEPNQGRQPQRSFLSTSPRYLGPRSQRHGQLPRTQVRVRRLGRGVLLEPMEPNVEDIKAIFAEIDRLGGNEFLPEGRPMQPPIFPEERR